MTEEQINKIKLLHSKVIELKVKSNNSCCYEDMRESSHKLQEATKEFNDYLNSLTESV